MKSAVLIIGGGGYIGQHISLLLAHNNYHVITLDCKTFPGMVCGPSIARITGDMTDTALLDRIFRLYKIESVVHCATQTSICNDDHAPALLYENDVGGMLALLSVMHVHEVGSLIFISSPAVYGLPAYIPVDEDHVRLPTTVEGKVKLALEHILEAHTAAYALRAIVLRPFNVVSCWSEAGLNPTHVALTDPFAAMVRAGMYHKPLTIYKSTNQQREARAYLHVRDVALAIFAALAHLQDIPTIDSFNLGGDAPYELDELVEYTQRLLKMPFSRKYAYTLHEHSTCTLAYTNKARQLLGWIPYYSSLEKIISDCIDSERRLQSSGNNAKVPMSPVVYE